MVLWIAYDAVIPALPSISAEFGASSSVTNLVLFPFLLAMALGQLISGTLSDRFGRKPVLVVSGALFFVFSALCALAPSIGLLVLFRIPEGLGCGAMMTMLITVVTDSYRGKAFDRAMTIMQALPIIGPVAAPFLGSLMMTLFTWHAIFMLLAVLGAASLVAVLLLDETLPASERLTTGMAANLRSMVPVCREPGFLGTTLVLALVGMPMMAFLAVSSYIYLEQFAIGYVGYSAFYAFTAGVGVLSPFVYLRLSGRVGENAIAKACLVVMGISGVMTGFSATRAPWACWLPACPCSLWRPFSARRASSPCWEDRHRIARSRQFGGDLHLQRRQRLGNRRRQLPLGQLRHGRHGRHAGMHRYGGGHLALSDQETPPAEALSRELAARRLRRRSAFGVLPWRPPP